MPSFKSVTTHRSRLFNNGLGFKRPVKVLSTGTTYTLKGNQSGILLVLKNAFSSGLTITLPADTAANIGFTCTIDQVFQGGGSNDNLLFNADVEGRMAGSVYHITIAAENTFFVEGHSVRSGQTPTNPWATS